MIQEKKQKFSVFMKFVSAGFSPALAKKTPPTAKAVSGIFGCRTRIRTQTNRVRVCCATLTQFGNIKLSLKEYLHIIQLNFSFVNYFFEFFSKNIKASIFLTAAMPVFAETVEVSVSFFTNWKSFS